MTGGWREHGPEPLRVEGRVPSTLRGTLYRNGPVRFGLGPVRDRHAFDGDGAVTAVRFSDDGVTGACRMVDTPWRRAEEAAGRRLFRDYARCGVGWRRWWLPPKNTANISVLPWQGDVLALFEAGLPFRLDGATLDTRGEDDLGGLRHALCAHPHAWGDELWGFGLKVGPSFSLDLYAMEPPAVRRIGSLPLPWPTLVHDMAVTRRFLVFFVAPRRLRLARLLAGIGDFRSNLAWEPERGTAVFIVPKDAPHRAVRVDAPAFFAWHTVHAWEEAGEVVVDLIAFDDDATDAWFGAMPLGPVGAPPPSRYVRARIDPARRRWSEEVRWDTRCEFPAVDGPVDGPPTAVWLLRWGADSGAARLARLDPSSGEALDVDLGPGASPSEPVRVAAAPGAAGQVLTLVGDGATGPSRVCVVDAGTREVVATAAFDHPIPFTFHGAWAPSAGAAPARRPAPADPRAAAPQEPS